MKKGIYQKASVAQIQQELLRRNWSINTELAVKPSNTQKKNSGKAKRVYVDGVIYESAVAAAKALGINPTSVAKRARKGGSKCYYLEESTQDE